MNHQWTGIPVRGGQVIVASIASYHGGDTAAVRLQATGRSWISAQIEEERSLDDEIGHVVERVDWITLPAGKILNAAGNPIGEAGYLRFRQDDRDQWQTKVLASPLLQPAIVSNVASFNGGHPVHTRVREVGSEAFQVQLEEWDYLDGPHAVEDVSYLAVRHGTHRLPNNLCLHAGRAEISGSWTQVDVSDTLVGERYVVSQVISERSPRAVVVRQRTVGDQLQMRLVDQEREQGQAGRELVAYLAVGTCQLPEDAGTLTVTLNYKRLHACRLESRVPRKCYYSLAGFENGSSRPWSMALLALTPIVSPPSRSALRVVRAYGRGSSTERITLNFHCARNSTCTTGGRTNTNSLGIGFHDDVADVDSFAYCVVRIETDPSQFETRQVSLACSWPGNGPQYSYRAVGQIPVTTVPENLNVTLSGPVVRLEVP